jgi:hypothetical protein
MREQIACTALERVCLIRQRARANLERLVLGVKPDGCERWEHKRGVGHADEARGLGQSRRLATRCARPTNSVAFQLRPVWVDATCVSGGTPPMGVSRGRCYDGLPPHTASAQTSYKSKDACRGSTP